MSLSVFDQFGNVDQLSISSNEAAIEALSEPARKALFELISADQAAIDGNARLTAARKALQECTAAHDAALATNNTLNKPQTHQEILLETIAANRPGYKPTPKGAVAIAAAKKAVADLTDKLASASEKAKPGIKVHLDQAHAVLAIAEKPVRAKEALHRCVEAVAIAQATLTQAAAAMKTLETRKSTAVLNWLSVQPDKPTDLDIRRASAKADNDRRLAEKRANPEPEGPKVWELEKVMKARGDTKRKQRQYLGPR